MVKYLVFSLVFLGIGALGIVSQNDALFVAGITSSNIYTVGNMLRTDVLVNKKENN